jgi:DNA mismatch repair ATPase MutS
LLGKILEWLIVYTLQVAFGAEAWKRKHGKQLRRWMAIAGEIEALISLATYSYEHPGDVFPEVVEAKSGSAFFDATEMGHPLIPARQCVRNSLRLDGATRVLLVSGSNMSGKSTLLRTVGINAVLAMAGAPVRAAALRMTELAIGTRIRSADSLQEGRSNFYTEILHIKSVFGLLGKEKALLFLFDELLDGTNSHDRSIGAE